MTQMTVKNKKILTTSLIVTITLVTAFAFITPQAQPAYAGFPSVGDIRDAIVNAVKAPLELLLDLIQDTLDDADFGLEALDDLLEDTDFGLEALDDLLEDADFGLDNLKNDPDVGIKRIAEDTQDSDFGLPAIDDEVEIIGARASTQLSRQSVDIIVKKADRMTYLQTSESGKPVDVDFNSVILISGMDKTELTPADVITPIPGVTGLYLLDIGKVSKVDTVFVEVQHPEDPIIHPEIPSGDAVVDHFGSVIFSPIGTTVGK